MGMIIAMLVFALVLLVILNVYKNNKIDKMESELKNLKNDIVEIRGVIYR